MAKQLIISCFKHLEKVVQRKGNSGVHVHSARHCRLTCGKLYSSRTKKKWPHCVRVYRCDASSYHMRSIAFNCVILRSIYSTIEMTLVNFKFFCLRKSFWGVNSGWIGGWVGGRVALDCCSQILNFTKSLERRTGLKWQLVHCGGERKVRAGLITLVDAKRKEAKPNQWKDAAVTFTPVPHSGQDSGSRPCTRQSTFFL